jgi:hypothetical protein
MKEDISLYIKEWMSKVEKPRNLTVQDFVQCRSHLNDLIDPKLCLKDLLSSVKEKHVNLVFYIYATIMSNIHDINQLNQDFFSSKALPAKIDYETYFTFRQRDVIGNTLRKNTII